MMKTGKPAVQGATSVDSSLTYSNSSLEVPGGPPSSQAKSKLNRFKIITSILKQGSSAASPRPPETSNGLPNGVLSPVPNESSSEKSSQNFPKDLTDFGLFQKHQWEGDEDVRETEEISKQMYSLTAEESGASGADGQFKDHRAEEEDGDGLFEKQTEENSTVNEAQDENNELLNTVCSSNDGRSKETEGKNKERSTRSDWVAGGCQSEDMKDAEI